MDNKHNARGLPVAKWMKWINQNIFGMLLGAGQRVLKTFLADLRRNATSANLTTYMQKQLPWPSLL